MTADQMVKGQFYRRGGEVMEFLRRTEDSEYQLLSYKT